jgi:Lhr-like helicase
MLADCREVAQDTPTEVLRLIIANLPTTHDGLIYTTTRNQAEFVTEALNRWLESVK